ncbi:MAG: GNAT family N-acetyltransferase [Candidatus Hermodarchaeota archaeon]
MTIEIQWGIPKDQYLRTARIIYESFEHKFRYTLGPREKAIAFIGSRMNDKYALVALKEGKVIGIAGAKTIEGELIQSNLIQWLRTYHLCALRTFVVALPFLLRRKQKDVFELIYLSVTNEARGHGIGTRIVKEFIRYAKSEGFLCVLLEVIDENVRAKTLYERLGFKTVKHEKVPRPWSVLLGLTGVSQMFFPLI